MKPSAYISEGGILFKESPPDSMIKLTPLYTGLKNLTDEEIISEWIGNDRNYYNFARAILRKASEK